MCTSHLLQKAKTKRNTHLRLSVNQNINIKLFLKVDNLLNFLLNGFNVIVLRDPEGNKRALVKRMVTLTFYKKYIKEIFQINSLVSLELTTNSPEFHSLRE